MFFSIYSSEENIAAQITVIEKQLDSTDISIMLAGVLSLCRKYYFPELSSFWGKFTGCSGLAWFGHL